MAIYRLTTTQEWTNRANYSAGDANDVMVVRADSPLKSREIASMSAGDEGAEAWLHESTIVEEIDPSGEPELIK